MDRAETISAHVRDFIGLHKPFINDVRAATTHAFMTIVCGSRKAWFDRWWSVVWLSSLCGRPQGFIPTREDVGWMSENSTGIGPITMHMGVFSAFRARAGPGVRACSHNESQTCRSTNNHGTGVRRAAVEVAIQGPQFRDDRRVLAGACVLVECRR
jgi:hypothetical protein